MNVGHAVNRSTSASILLTLIAAFILGVTLAAFLSDEVYRPGGTVLFGVMGFDGGVHRHHALYGHPVPYQGGSRPMLIAMVIVVLLTPMLLTALAVGGWIKSSRIRRALARASLFVPAVVTLWVLLAWPPLGWVWQDVFYDITRNISHWGLRTAGPPTWPLLVAHMLVVVAAIAFVVMLQLPRNVWWSLACISHFVLIFLIASIFAMWMSTATSRDPTGFHGAIHAAKTGVLGTMYLFIWCGITHAILGFTAPRIARTSAWRRRRQRPPLFACAGCGYDLRGTVAAGHRACPECGERVAGEQYNEIRIHTRAARNGALTD